MNRSVPLQPSERSGATCRCLWAAHLARCPQGVWSFTGGGHVEAEPCPAGGERTRVTEEQAKRPLPSCQCGLPPGRDPLGRATLARIGSWSKPVIRFEPDHYESSHSIGSGRTRSADSPSNQTAKREESTRQRAVTAQGRERSLSITSPGGSLSSLTALRTSRAETPRASSIR